MAGRITINKVIFPNTPSGVSHLTVEHKLATQPASSYVLFTSDMPVDVDGIPTASPLPTITGLTSGALYDVRFTENCGSPSPYWIEQITPE